MLCQFFALFDPDIGGSKTGRSREHQVYDHRDELPGLHDFCRHPGNSHLSRMSLHRQDEDPDDLDQTEHCKHVTIAGFIILDAFGRKESGKHKQQVQNDRGADADLIIEISHIVIHIGFINIQKVSDVKDDRNDCESGGQ